MHRTQKGAALALAVAVALPASAFAAPEQDFSVTVDGSSSSVRAGSKKKPRAHALRISTGTVQSAPGIVPATTTEARISFPRGAKFNGWYFRACSSSTIAAGKSTDDCTSSSRVGSGSAAGLASGGIVQNDLDITAVNGTRGTYVNLFVEGSSPLRIQSNIVAQLRTLKGGSYSYRLDVPIPKNLQEPAAGVKVAVTKFVVSLPRKTITRKGRKVGYVESVSCPSNRTLRFKGVFSYDTGEKTTVTDTLRCRK